MSLLAQILNRRLAVQLLGIFATALKGKFVPKLKSILPLVENQLHPDVSDGPGKFVKAPVLDEPEELKMENDQLVFQVLQLYKTLMETCPIMLTDPSYVEQVQLIAGNEAILSAFQAVYRFPSFLKLPILMESSPKIEWGIFF